MISIRLLGQFEVRRDSQPVELASRPAQSLLAYLLLNAGIEFRREKLAGVIWPEATEDNARTYLRQALWRIRKAIGADYLLADRMSVAFNATADYGLDVDILEKPMEAGWTTGSLGEALGVYKGELLPGFYEDWAALERDRLQTVFEQRIRQLLVRLIEEGHWKIVLHWGERWIALGHTSETAYRALMIAHAGMGDLARMASAYERCVDALASDLGVEPSSETQQLYKQLQEDGQAAVKASADLFGSPSAEFSAGDQHEESPIEFQPAFLKTTHPVLSLSAESLKRPFEGAFIRRENELTILEQHFEQALKDQGQVLFITGEAGQGKTTLLHEFSKRIQLANSDVIVASGACCLVYTPVTAPYDLFREVLEMLTGAVEAAWFTRTISRDQAVHNWNSLPDTIDILIHHGPNLVGTLIPAEPLLSRARSAAIGQER
jgi:DNA-binding SARP family transcriptional activator